MIARSSSSSLSLYCSFIAFESLFDSSTCKSIILTLLCLSRTNFSSSILICSTYIFICCLSLSLISCSLTLSIYLSAIQSTMTCLPYFAASCFLISLSSMILHCLSLSISIMISSFFYSSIYSLSSYLDSSNCLSLTVMTLDQNTNWFIFLTSSCCSSSNI